jgi:hypothetical protein
MFLWTFEVGQDLEKDMLFGQEVNKDYAVRDKMFRKSEETLEMKAHGSNMSL